MNDDFSLEKLKINDRLHAVELQVARLVSHIDSEKGTFGRVQEQSNAMFQRIMEIVTRHDKLFFGDGNPGILTKMDRQEQIEDGRKWHFRVLWATIFTMMMKFLHDFFTQKP